MSGAVHYAVAGRIASVTFDRPEARNAMTWAMYDALGEACARIAADPDIRVATFRGAGGEAFIAGTDIAQFRSFAGGEDGVAYERTIDARIAQIEALPVPTLAIIDGWTMGGGLAIAAACDFRVGTPAAKFGVPIARTLGNCLSIANTARVVAAFGAARAKKLLMLAATIGAEEARACGFLLDVADPGAMDEAVAALCAQLQRNAPVTMRVSKEAIRRLGASAHPNGEDLVREAYGSEDFKRGVEAFLGKQKVHWRGR